MKQLLTTLAELSDEITSYDITTLDGINVKFSVTYNNRLYSFERRSDVIARFLQIKFKLNRALLSDRDKQKIAIKVVRQKTGIIPEKHDRKSENVKTRHITFKLIKDYTILSLRVIGMTTFPSCKPYDHSTVLHAVRSINNRIETDKAFKHYYKDIEAEFLKRIKNR